MTGALTVHAAAATTVGTVRRRNEDAYYQGRWLFAIADGMGGHVAGDVASNTVIESIGHYDRQVPALQLSDTLGRAVDRAGDAMRRKVHTRPALAGMGTTLVALLISGDRAVLANIGDSRAYLLPDDGPLTRLTEDHLYEQLVARADLVPTLPAKLSRFLDGRPEGRSPDLTPVRLHPGSRLLLCSDGLSSYVPEEAIRTTMKSDRRPDETAAELIRLSLDAGGKDNTTVLVIDVPM